MYVLTYVYKYNLIVYDKGYTVKNEVCKAHQIVSIYTLFGEKCAYRDILVCMAHFSIYSVGLGGVVVGWRIF